MKMDKNKKKWILRAAQLLCILVMAIAAYQLWSYYRETGESEYLYENMAAERDAAAEKSEKADPPTPEELYGAFYKANEDFVGWLTVEGTVIDYPVVQSKEKDYYLYRNFEKEENRCGCLFLDSACTLGESDNLLIHGHHMKNGSMFAALTKFGSKDFYKEHKTFRFDTLEEFGTYEIIAVMKIGLTDEQHFPYYDFINAADETVFDAFISECKAQSLYKIEADAQYGDQLITLSTCEYSKEEGRMVVVGKKIG